MATITTIFALKSFIIFMLATIISVCSVTAFRILFNEYIFGVDFGDKKYSNILHRVLEVAIRYSIIILTFYFCFKLLWDIYP